MKASVKRGLLIAGGVLGVLLIVVAVLVVRQANRAGEVLDQLAQPGTPQREIGVYVLDQDPAQTLEDTVGYSYGGVEGGVATVQVAAQALGTQPQWTSYPTAFALADALEKGECQAVALEEAYQKSLSDARGYEWTETGMRKVGSFQVEAESQTPAPPQGTLDRFLVYLGGSDTFGEVSTLARSDVNILAAVDVTEKRMALVATPRDFYVTFPKTGGEKDKLAHAGIYGVESSVAALEELYGVEVSYYLRMNFTGFVEVIDALGGVSVYSDREFTVENIRTYQEGFNQLTGIEALAFARERMSFPEGDYQRAKNQMEVIRAVGEKLSSPAVVGALPGLLDAVEGNFETNLPREQILALAPALAGGWEISTYTAAGLSDYRETWSMPGAKLYVILPDQQSVAQGKEILEEVLQGEA
ncbi:MAG: LCP family protein [Acutalibacter sp.]